MCLKSGLLILVLKVTRTLMTKEYNTRIQEYFPKKDITKIPKNKNNHLNKIALIQHKHSPRYYK